MAVATQLARSLEAYTDKTGSITVIGPRGWSCTALDAADGGQRLSVFPPGATASSSEAVVADQTSACAGCTLGQACPLFTAAARAFRASFGRPCPRPRPRREATRRLGKTTIAFEDPPYVKGDGVPSGDRFTAHGVVTYLDPYYQGPSYLETCTMPEVAHSTCTAILDDFVARYGKR